MSIPHSSVFPAMARFRPAELRRFIRALRFLPDQLRWFKIWTTRSFFKFQSPRQKERLRLLSILGFPLRPATVVNLSSAPESQHLMTALSAFLAPSLAQACRVCWLASARCSLGIERGAQSPPDRDQRWMASMCPMPIRQPHALAGGHLLATGFNTIGSRI